MKKSDVECVYCCACSPFARFWPPNAAEQLREHYASEAHATTSYASGSAVRVD